MLLGAQNVVGAGLLSALLAIFLFGCMTPSRAKREASEAAVARATAYWQKQTGTTNAFDIARPADVLTLRIALEAVRQGVTNAVFPRIAGVAPLQPSNGVASLSLDDALRIGARNNRKYQTLKETVYQRALTLDSEDYAFDTKFSSFILGALTGNPELTREYGQAGGGATRKFEQGATMAGNLALDVTKMIRDDWHSFAWTGDLTMTVPLMRGSGRDIVREPLTQAERNLEYALLTFQRYRQTYALSIAKAYYNVLKYAQNRRNSDDNAKRLETNWNRAEMMFKAGRMDRIQVDQARTDLLAARQTIITTQQSYEDALDNFKITLGLPPEAPLALKDEELRFLQTEMDEQVKRQPDALSDYPVESEALNIALVERRDLVVTAGDVHDAERAVRIAEDNLRADLAVEGGVGYDASRRQHGRGVDDSVDTDVKLKWTAPWDRRRERNAYRKALIALDQARRTLEETEDAIKNEVRAGYRDLVASRLLYENKVEAFKVAQMRVQAIDLFMQSGRSSMRDILESESALLTARNALVSAVIQWRTSDLSLRSAMGILRIEHDGTWVK
ncbi:MAG: TolC family protein [Kiritimatiellia bacterium]